MGRCTVRLSLFQLKIVCMKANLSVKLTAMAVVVIYDSLLTCPVAVVNSAATCHSPVDGYMIRAGPVVPSHWVVA